MDSNSPGSNSGARVPVEIFQSFFQDLGYSLLIKGEAGVGKTTLALELLHQFDTPIYFSTRVAPSSLYQQFPWLQGRLAPENIIDATRTFLPPYHEVEALRTHIRQTLRFNSIPEFLKLLYGKIEELGNPTIVIDSWDAILATMLQDNSEKTHMETLLVEFVRQMKVKLILVAETERPSYLDYIVDGIVTLRDEPIDDGTVRTLEIQKTRGVMRRQKHYMFTLYQNHFQYFPSFNVTRPDHIKPWVVDPDREDVFSTGNPDLNVLYATGLKPGTFNLLEVDSKIPEAAYAPIFLGFVCNFLSQERGVILRTMEGINSELIDKKRLFLYETTENINKYLRVLSERITNRHEIRPYIVQVEQDAYQDTFLDVYEGLSSLTRFQPVFAGIAYDSLSFQINYEKSIAEIYQHLKTIKNSNIIELGIFNSSTRAEKAHGPEKTLISDISYLADTHLKISSHNGAIIIQGVKPFSGAYNLSYTIDEGFPRVKLTPIV